MSKIFYQEDREQLKAEASPALRAYIETLEDTAKASFEVWKNTPHANRPTSLTIDCLNDLYDALQLINFMEEE